MKETPRAEILIRKSCLDVSIKETDDNSSVVRHVEDENVMKDMGVGTSPLVKADDDELFFRSQVED